MWGWEGQPPSLGDRSPSTQALSTILLHSPNSGRPESSSASKEPAAFTGGALEGQGWPNSGGQGQVFATRCESRHVGTWSSGCRSLSDVPFKTGEKQMVMRRGARLKDFQWDQWNRRRNLQPTTPPQAEKLVLPSSERAHRRQCVPVSLLEKQLFPKLLNHTPLCLGKGTCK